MFVNTSVLQNRLRARLCMYIRGIVKQVARFSLRVAETWNDQENETGCAGHIFVDIPSRPGSAFWHLFLILCVVIHDIMSARWNSCHRVHLLHSVCFLERKKTMHSFNCNCTQLLYLFQKENIFVHHDVFIGVEKPVCTILINYPFMISC